MSDPKPQCDYCCEKPATTHVGGENFCEECFEADLERIGGQERREMEADRERETDVCE
jgi:hypothetical protein